MVSNNLFDRFLRDPFVFSSGRALLELQSLMPHSTTFCVNKKGYNYAQASTRNELALIAEHYSIPILCSTGHHNNRNKNAGVEKIKSQPILPHIRLTSGVQKEAFTYPHASMKLILSQHAINEGFHNIILYICRYQKSNMALYSSRKGGASRYFHGSTSHCHAPGPGRICRPAPSGEQGEEQKETKLISLITVCSLLFFPRWICCIRLVSCDGNEIIPSK